MTAYLRRMPFLDELWKRLVVVIAFIGLCCLFCAILLFMVPALIVLYLKLIYTERPITRNKNRTITVGIFHPYCNAGAGGERVLWAAVQSLQLEYDNVQIYIYTGDIDVSKEKILANVKRVFDIEIQENVYFVYLHQRKWIEAKMYPYCTMLGQSMGSIWLGCEALMLLTPDIYIDTMGYAFTYPLFKYIGQCNVATYTHYPTISIDMLEKVHQREPSHNNRGIIAKNSFLTAAKIGYYRGFAFLYAYAGRTVDVIMVNSSWTKGHIDAIWGCSERIHRLYPPCDTDKLANLLFLSEEEKNYEIRIVSVGQFRPEKNHVLMLEAMKKVKELVDDESWKKLHLVLIGSCRNEDDQTLVEKLIKMSNDLGLDSSNVEFKLNLPYSELITEMQRGTIGLHAMWNEHFGISIVDGMCVGLIMIAHASGGPKTDIITIRDGLRNGFLAEKVDEYAKTIALIVKMGQQKRNEIRNCARKSVKKFSTKNFQNEFTKIVEPFFKAKPQ